MKNAHELQILREIILRNTEKIKRQDTLALVMYDDIVEKILKSIEGFGASQDVYPKFSSKGYNTHKIEGKNFHEIEKSPSEKRMAFVDGGNLEIISSANFSLNLIRIAYIIYSKNSKQRIKRDIFAFIKSESENDEIHFKATFFPSNKFNDLSFSSYDNTIMKGTNRAEIANVANVIRRFLELRIAKDVSDNKLADAVILDGNLQCTFTNENSYMEELRDSCAKNKIILAALSKTSSIFTDNGDLLNIFLDRISIMKEWYYNPIVTIENPSHRAEMFIVKLNSKSRHIFRFEIIDTQKEMANEIIANLQTNSIDPIFLGYPYGLVEADRLARVNNNEKESLKTMFLAKLGSKNVERYMNSLNAHKILDKISF